MNGSLNFYSPLFKFLEKQWADEMRLKGSIKLSYISEFRNNIYTGKIHDKDEGFLLIENFYNDYKGFAKDANGLIRYLFPPDCKVNFKKQKILHTINIFDLLVYCTSSFLFSESLNQAFLDGKDSCIMISHPELFFQIISEELKEFSFLGSDFCNYNIGKHINEIDPTEDSLTNKIFSNLAIIALIKPLDFINQMEYRAIWTPKTLSLDLNPLYLKNKNLINYCFPIDISKVDTKKILEYKADVQVICTIRSKKGIESFSTYSNVHKIPTPVIVNHPDFNNPLVGFFTPGNKIYRLRVGHAEIGMISVDEGLLHNLIFLEDLISFKYELS